MDTYSNINEQRVNNITNNMHSNLSLNAFHDQIITAVVQLAIKKTIQKRGPLPSSFCFFLMGSGGRAEQGVWSDQDHGLLFSSEDSEYFLTLGDEISDGMAIAGYPYCEGQVMARNKRWCQSTNHFKQQITNWLEEASWESLRHFLTFLDARVLIGDQNLLTDVKQHAYTKVIEFQLLPRLLENTLHTKRNTNLLGQIIVESKGPHTGAINVKEAALLPMINAARLLAVESNCLATSTLTRLQGVQETILSPKKQLEYMRTFESLLAFRLLHADHSSYENSHYIHISQLPQHEVLRLKKFLKSAHQLHLFVKKRLGNR